VNLGNVRLFKDIVHAKSISRGAALNHISQSAASQHLQELERQLGTTLLDRTSRPFTVTPAGKLYYEMCREVLRSQEQFQVALERLKSRVEGTVRVASIYSIGLSDMSRLEEEFRRRHPSAQLRVEYLRPEKVYDAVASDHADLGLVSYPESTKELACIKWREEEMAVATWPAHPLANRGSVTPQELRGQDFVAFDEDLPIRREIDHYLKQHGVNVRVVLHFDVVQMIKEAVAWGSGISILPARVMHPEVKQGRLAAIALDSPKLFRPVGIIYRRRRPFNLATQVFLELLDEKPAPEVQAV
jgi:LysR family transcriptional regulator, transcriptional activator of the cysJI operon